MAPKTKARQKAVEMLQFLIGMKTYTAVIERCPDTDQYVGYVPGFPGAQSQGRTIDELNQNLHEVIEMLLDEGPA